MIHGARLCDREQLSILVLRLEDESQVNENDKVQHVVFNYSATGCRLN